MQVQPDKAHGVKIMVGRDGTEMCGGLAVRALDTSLARIYALDFWRFPVNSSSLRRMMRDDTGHRARTYLETVVASG